MNSPELMPALAGLALGLLLAWFRSRKHRWMAGILVVVIGISATIASGEFRISWGFLFIDIPLVAVAAVAGFAIFRLLNPGRPSSIK